jgi:hypothetical protein
VTTRIREFHAAGADEVVVRFASSEPEAQLLKLAREVVPGLT